RRVAARQALERRRLVSAEVVDVHLGMRAERFENAIDDGFECVLLLGRRPGPERRVARADDVAEEVLAAAVGCEPVAFEVEKQIVRRGRRQPREPVLRSERLEQREAPLVAPAGFELNRGLIADADERLARAAFRLLDRAQVAELRERVDVQALAQLFDLQAAYSCDEAQMIVGAAARVALAPPRADVAVLRG